ncbi:MAG: hypothetical protein LBU32_29655 [Clostridiales bacterium]|jgi:hypothetical protein|nr:hypothetical protein [Clostridiales bacterium]
MYNFEASFIDDMVCINDKHFYKSNEILNYYLNLDSQRFGSILSRLKNMKAQLMLFDDVPIDFITGYDEHVQNAQKLLSSIDNITMNAPPFCRCIPKETLTELKLFDCLNSNFSFWRMDEAEGPYGCEEAPLAGIQDDVPAVGEKCCDNIIRNVFPQHLDFPEVYLNKFYPNLNDRDPELLVDIERTNESVAALIDRYISLVDDMLRVKTAYADFLDNYIHSKNRRLTSEEIAELADSYFAANNSKTNAPHMQLVSSGSMMYTCKVVGSKNSLRLCESFVFETLGAFLYYDFFRGLKRGYAPKRSFAERGFAPKRNLDASEYFLIEGHQGWGFGGGAADLNGRK